MLNRDEVYPKDLREKLDINNFKNKPWNSPPSIITKYTEGETKTFKFHRENMTLDLQPIQITELVKNGGKIK